MKLDMKISKWAVMKVLSINSIKVSGVPLRSEPGDPQWFIPVFDTREDALKWSNGDEKNVFELEGLE